MFLYKKKSRSHSDRPGRVQMGAHLADDQFDHVAQKMVETYGCQTIKDYASAAIVWFDSLDRSRMVEIALDFQVGRSCRYAPSVRKLIRNKRRAHRAISIPDVVAEKADAWNFPNFTQSRVVAAAMMAFGDLPNEQRRLWVLRMVQVITCGEPTRKWGEEI